MSNEKKAPAAAVVANALMNMLPLAIMAWAAFETDGVIRWLLAGWVVFSIVIVFLTAGSWSMNRGRA